MAASSPSRSIEALQWLTKPQALRAAAIFGTPVYLNSEIALTARAREALAFQAPYGLTVRYAMKANPLAAILRLFNGLGVQMDASSEHEVYRAMKAGVKPEHIMLTSQQLPADLGKLVRLGIIFNATSLHQLEMYGKLFPGSLVSIRLNPGIGSGHSQKTNVGGPTSSFGIWHEYVPEVKKLASAHRLNITKIHTHIGAGTDPKIWHAAARLTLKLAEQFPTVTSVNLGGGFKVARMAGETAADLGAISQSVAELITSFASLTGRRLHVEIEPGTYLVANAGALVSRVIDIVDTGANGYQFLKLDTGLTEIMRPSLYAAQHPIVVVNEAPASPRSYVVVGHTCESGDLLTPDPAYPDVPTPRLLQQAAIGDIVVIEGTGAYCASMSATGYNSFPEAPEAMLNAAGEFALARRPLRQHDHFDRDL